MTEEYISKQITNLRKNGKLNEAYELSKEAKKQNPDDVWIERALSWTLYDYLKENQQSIPRYKRVIKEIANYNFDYSDHTMFFENVVKNIRYVGWKLYKKNRKEELFQLFLIVADLFGEKVFFESSTIFQMFLVGFGNDAVKQLQLIDWYGFNRFNEEDYTETMYKERVQLSLVDSTMKKYLDAVVTRKAEGSFIGTEEQINFAINQAKMLLEKHETYKWTRYSLSKVFIKTGRFEEGRNYFIPFAQKNSNQAYVWETFAEFYKGSANDLYYACIFKALTLRNKVEFTLSYRKKAITYFVNIAQDYAAAKHEVELIRDCKAAKGWKEDEDISELITQQWFDKTVATKNNEAQYAVLSEAADDLLYSELEPVDFYVEWKDEEKGLIGIVINEKRIMLKDKTRVKELRLGRVYLGKILIEGTARIIGQLTISNNKAFKERYVQQISNIFEKISDFGFIQDPDFSAYVHPRIVSEQQLKDFSTVNGIAYKRYHTNKKRWTWELGEVVSVTVAKQKDYQSEFTGRIQITRGGFGFVEDCFVPKDLIEKYKINDFEVVKVKAMKSWDRKRYEWSWKVYEFLEVDGLILSEMEN